MPILVKAITPGQINTASMRRSIAGSVLAMGNEIKKDFEETADIFSTIQNRPKFSFQYEVSEDSLAIFVHTDSLRYRWINDGTARRSRDGGNSSYPIFSKKISPKTGQRLKLRYPRDFIPKSSPNSLSVNTFYGYGGPPVFRKILTHPGIRPRRFDETIARKWQLEFNRRMEEALIRAVQASGHQI